MKLPTSAEMKKLDQSATKNFGIPSIVLMENAGLGTVHMALRELGPCQNSFALIFIGPGNNGGDGLVIGRHLYQRGCQPVFFFLVSPDTLTGDSAVNLNIIRKLRLPFHVVDNPARVETIPILYKQLESRGLPCYAIFDSIFGIGLSRKVSGHFADTIKLINSPNFAPTVPVISVDTPSGMDADTGKAQGECVRANYTATYCCAKPGQFIHGGVSWTGKLEVVDIGIPPEALLQANITTERTTREQIANLLAPLRRNRASHKGDHGHLLLIAGSAGKSGAALLAARGGLRCGSGLVSLCGPKSLMPIFETALSEAMTIPLSASTTAVSSADIETIDMNLGGKKAVVIGPGIGTGPETAELVLDLYHSMSLPLILDADALNILATHRDLLRSPAGPRIFTPHPGELGRLLGKSNAEIQDNRLDAVVLGRSLFAHAEHSIIMVLKGAGTIIAGPSGQISINTTGNPGMATGGMGDVLSGVIGGLICQGLTPHAAAIAGAYLHGKAADVIAETRRFGYLASEVADMLPETISSVLADS